MLPKIRGYFSSRKVKKIRIVLLHYVGRVSFALLVPKLMSHEGVIFKTNMT